MGTRINKVELTLIIKLFTNQTFGKRTLILKLPNNQNPEVSLDLHNETRKSNLQKKSNAVAEQKLSHSTEHWNSTIIQLGRINRSQWTDQLLAASLHIEIKVGNINVNRPDSLPPFLGEVRGWEGGTFFHGGPRDSRDFNYIATWDESYSST